MSAPSNLIALPGYPGYFISPDGLDVWRVDARSRGPRAGETFRLKTHMHPRGRRWYAHVYNAAGVRVRVSLERLAQDAGLSLPTRKDQDGR